MKYYALLFLIALGLLLARMPNSAAPVMLLRETIVPRPTPVAATAYPAPLKRRHIARRSIWLPVIRSIAP